jgi:hypothetical protein
MRVPVPLDPRRQRANDGPERLRSIRICQLAGVPNLAR